ncbi:MAG: hypothetical protein SYC29_15790 [Planctomycetota bacterium]|nr:hypothetical protein [Planctomycetota bacterium]
MRCTLLSAFLILPFFLCACESTEDLMPPPVVHTPLTLDPMEEYELGEWWTNGDVMLRLDETGFYALYGEMNRYHRPVQRGKWWQQSYAVLWLEPYEALRTEWVRVQISKIDDRLALTIPKRDPMFAIAQPPPVMEDRLLGQWTSEKGTLFLSGNLRYTLTPARAEIDQRAIIAGHRGTWRLADDRLLLTPDPPNMGPFEFRVEQTDDEPRLRGRETTFSRMQH